MEIKKYQTVINPFTGKLQRILSEPFLAQSHGHNISDINDLQEQLDNIKKPTGYFAN